MRLELRGGTIDLDTGDVARVDGTSVRLTDTERRLLAWLAEHPDRDLERDELLAEVWGYRPGTRTRALDTAIKVLRRKVEIDPSTPEHVLTVRGVGYRFVPPVARVEVPEPTADLVGRRGLLADVASALATGRLVTLIGPGGVGKTRLATEVVRRRGDVVFVPLADVTDARSLASRVALHVDAPGGGNPTAAVGRALADATVLLVLDNLEQVLGPAAEVVACWLDAAPGLTVLTTSRQRLGLDGEAVIEVAPLDGEEAVALLRTRARTLRPGFGAGQDKTLHAIARALDGLPLALELAAARASVLDPEELYRRLDRPAVLRRHHGADRHRSLEAVVAWSWDLLSAPERDALARCATFVGSFTVDAAEAVLEGEEEPVELLDALLAASLLRRTEDGTRLTMLETIRAFALQQLPEPESTWRRAAAWVVAATERADRDVLIAEAGNLQAVLDRPTSTPTWIGQAALALDRLYRVTGPLATRIEALDRGVEAVHAAVDPHLAARLRMCRAYARQLAGQDPGDDWTAALGHAEAAGDRTLEGQVLGYLGRQHYAVGDLDRAEDLWRRALDIHREVGDRIHEADRVSNLGTIAVDRGDLEGALARFLEALPLHQQVGNDVNASRVMGHLGTTYLKLGRLELSRQWLHRAAEASAAAGFVAGQMRIDANLALVDLESGNHAAAAAGYRRTVDTAITLGEPMIEGIARAELARCLVGLGELREASEEAARATRMLTDLGAVPWEAHARTIAGVVALALGEHQRAREALDVAVRRSRDARNPSREATALAYRSLLTGSEDVERAAALMDDGGGAALVAVARDAADGTLTDGDDDWEEARRLRALALALRGER